MWNDVSEDTGAFPKTNNMDINYIEDENGTQLVMGINIFNAWVLSQYKIVFEVQKKLHWSIYGNYPFSVNAK